MLLFQKNVICPMTDAELPTTVCKNQEPRSDGGLCSSCQQTLDCIGGGITTYCTGDRHTAGDLMYCVPLEQVAPGCRCQRKRDCYGYEDQINACRQTANYPEPFGSMFADDGTRYCVPYGVV